VATGVHIDADFHRIVGPNVCTDLFPSTLDRQIHTLVHFGAASMVAG